MTSRLPCACLSSVHHLQELARIKDGDIFKLSQRQQVGCVHQWGQPRSAALYYVETFPRVRGNKKGALPQAVNAPQQVFIATYNAVCPCLFRSSQEFVVAGIVRNNLNQVLRCDFQTVGFKEGEQTLDFLGREPKTWAAKHAFILAQNLIAEYCLESALLHEQIYNLSTHTTDSDDARDHRVWVHSPIGATRFLDALLLGRRRRR